MLTDPDSMPWRDKGSQNLPKEPVRDLRGNGAESYERRS